jgi:RNA 3'-terminal phosphate cyclase (ATP)
MHKQTQRSLHIHSIRAGRSKPGLQPQHLAGVRLVAEIGRASLRNGFQGSTVLRLDPPLSSEAAPVASFHADPGTAGSVTLLLQASLPCLAFHPTNLGGGPIKYATHG